MPEPVQIRRRGKSDPTVRSHLRCACERLELRTLLDATDPFISEFMAINSNGILDNYQDRSDWIEIYNPGTTAVNLAKWALSDDKGTPLKWKFPDITLNAKAYIRVWASDRNDRDPLQPLHTNFKLDGDNGEYLALRKPDGTVVTEFDPFPVQRDDVSYGFPLSNPAATPGYLQTSTPGAVNSGLATSLGPIVEEVGQTPVSPQDSDDVTVTTKLTPTSRPVGAVTLYYRADYGGEAAVAMRDDGLHGDGAAGDGVFGAVIPKAASGPGQMLRYYVSAADDKAFATRSPGFTEPTNSPQYYGTMIANPGVASTLPILYWWTQNPSAAQTTTGTRCSVYYLGKFYDNVFVRDRGGFSTNGYKFDFNAGDRFQREPDGQKVDEIDVNYWSLLDNTLIRPVVSFDVYRDAGSAYSTVQSVRVQRNGSFETLAYMVEVPDEDYLDRQGLAQGAIYKLTTDHPTMTNASLYEKKTLRDEGYSDLTAFLAGIHQAGTAQYNYIFDNIDIPAMLDYLAATTLVNDNDDVQKNYFLYRETDGDREWRFLPWDKDLTFGMNYGIGSYAAVDPQTHPFFGDSNHPKIDGPSAYNFLIDALLDTPVIKQMYLRRLRTLMDQMLQESSTPYAARYMEQHLDQIYTQLTGDPVIMSWFSSKGVNLATEFSNIKNLYLAKRRTHLYVDHSTNTSYPGYAGIPAAQPAAPNITFGTIDFNPVSGNQEQEYIQLKNPNSYAVDLSDWTISGGIDYTFDKGVVIPANGTIYLSPDLPAFRSRTTGPTGGMGLFVVGPYRGDQLNANGETLTLHNVAGTTISTTSFRPAPTVAQQALRITEVMYHPADAPGNVPTDTEFEYIELKNISAQALPLAGIRFTQGIDFVFPSMTLQPGAYTLVVRNRAAFESRYRTGLPIAGEYLVDALANTHQAIQLKDAQGEEILDFTYYDTWYPSTDGLGRSLTILNPNASYLTWDDPASWRPSYDSGGSPGVAGPAADLVPPTVQMSATGGPDRAFLDPISVTFSEPIYGLELADLVLTADGRTIAWTAGQTLTTSDGGQTWLVGNLGALTSAPAQYVLSLDAAAAHVADVRDNPLAAGTSISLVVNTIVTGLAGDLIKVQRNTGNPSLLNIWVNTSGQPTYTLTMASFPRLVIETGAGDDTITLDASQISGINSLLLNTGDGADTLVLTATSSVSDLNIQPGMVVVTGRTITTTALERTALDAPAGATISVGQVTVAAPLAVSSGKSLALVAGTLVMSGAGRLDLGNSPLILSSTPLTSVNSWISNGRLGVTPAMVAGNGLLPAAVDNAMIHQTSWAGRPLTGFSQVLIQPSLPGDANLDGLVDQRDTVNVISRMGHSGSWLEGDLNCDGLVTADDLAEITARLTGGGTSMTAGPLAVVAQSPATASKRIAPKPKAKNVRKPQKLQQHA